MTGLRAGDRVPAVVVRTHPVGEADLVVVLLSPGQGRLECRARGARKSRKRFPGGLSVGARGLAEIGRGRGKLPPLDGFEPSAHNVALGRDLEAFAYAAYACELADQLVTGMQAEPAAFAALCEALDAILESPRPEVLRRYEIALLDALGLLPALDACCVCGRPVEGEGNGFDARRGGVLCEIHGASVPGLAAGVIPMLRELAAGRTAELEGAPPALRRGVRDQLQGWVRPHLRRELRSLAFFAQIARVPRSRGGDGEGFTA